MELEEWENFVACVECGGVLDMSLDPVFAFDDDDCLCVECATKRGAVYDSAYRTWTRPPDLRGLV